MGAGWIWEIDCFPERVHHCLLRSAAVPHADRNSVQLPKVSVSATVTCRTYMFAAEKWPLRFTGILLWFGGTQQIWHASRKSGNPVLPRQLLWQLCVAGSLNTHLQARSLSSWRFCTFSFSRTVAAVTPGLTLKALILSTPTQCLCAFLLKEKT